MLALAEALVAPSPLAIPLMLLSPLESMETLAKMETLQKSNISSPPHEAQRGWLQAYCGLVLPWAAAQRPQGRQASPMLASMGASRHGRAPTDA